MPVAALAYVLLPVSGLIAFLKGSTQRTRFHGLQAIVVGAAWPVLLYAATWTAPVVTQAVAVVGTLLWVALIVTTALGKDLQLPVVGGRLRTAAEAPVAGDHLSPVR
ncbi:MAG: hypothetical protein QOD46_1388 [Actinomycetota bacterium]|nr:hypothetical protein [Actinomycetota bacterium]